MSKPIIKAASLNLALYGRVSTERQDVEGVSIEQQIEQIKLWAATNNHTVVDIFLERGVSAFSLEKKRPEFDRMVAKALLPERPYDLIVVHSQSRLYRNNAERELLEQKLERNGVRVYISSQPRPEDDLTSFLIRNIQGSVDEWQSRNSGRRVAECMQKNAKDGYFNGSRPPYGYVAERTDIPARSGVKKVLKVNSEEAEVVRRIFHLAHYGSNGRVVGVKSIAQLLNGQNISHRGVKWTKGHVEQLLANRVYIGEYVTFRTDSRTNRPRPQSEWVITPVEAIITAEEFSTVHKIMASRRPPNTENRAAQVPTLLTGLLRCGHCGKSLTLMTGKSGKYRYYACASKQKISPRECICPNLPKEKLEEFVLETLVSRVLNIERTTAILGQLAENWKKVQKPDPKRIRVLGTRIAALDSSLAQLYEQIGTRTLKIDATLTNFISAKQADRERLVAERRTLELRQQLPFRKLAGHKANDSFELRGMCFRTPKIHELDNLCGRSSQI